MSGMKITSPLTQTCDRASNRILARGASTTTYNVRLARSDQEIREAQNLRFRVFNVEMGEGLEESYQTLLDQDPLDEVCDHLIVEHAESGHIVGTYRMQTGITAAENLGFYSDGEFDLTPFKRIQHEIVELGRACVHSEHRNMEVLGLLWNAIVAYSRERKCRYLIGCSSMSTVDPHDGAAAYQSLSRKYLVSSHLHTTPRNAYRFEMPPVGESKFKGPKLFRAYLAMGSRICGEPAMDREFKTIDFLTFHDLQTHPVRRVATT
ncbi:MAG: GNAT family N-acetyltransferase [Limisphaerales bacterium]